MGAQVQCPLVAMWISAYKIVTSMNLVETLETSLSMVGDSDIGWAQPCSYLAEGLFFISYDTIKSKYNEKMFIAAT